MHWWRTWIGPVCRRAARVLSRWAYVLLLIAIAAAVLASSVPLAESLTRSCAVRAQYWHGRRLEARADGFQRVPARLESLQEHHCDGCWAFGEVQRRQSGWLEGTFTYEWDGVSYSSDRLAAATDRGHLSQGHVRGRWGRTVQLQAGARVDAWLDPEKPDFAILDRTHYVARSELWEEGRTACDRAARAFWLMLYGLTGLAGLAIVS